MFLQKDWYRYSRNMRLHPNIDDVGCISNSLSFHKSFHLFVRKPGFQLSKEHLALQTFYYLKKKWAINLFGDYNNNSARYIIGISLVYNCPAIILAIGYIAFHPSMKQWFSKQRRYGEKKLNDIKSMVGYQGRVVAISSTFQHLY